MKGMYANKAAKSSKSYEDDYEAEHDLRTLIEAEKIKGDKARVKAAMKCAERKRAEMKKALDGMDA